MTKFDFVAVSADGLVASGSRRGDTRGAVELDLFEDKYRDIRVTEHKGVGSIQISAQRVKRVEVMHLSRQLAAFIGAGLPLLEAVKTIGTEASNSTLRKIMTETEEGLRTGDSLSECFDRYPKVFPEFYRGILRSAELTGQLDVVLAQLSLYLERDLEATRKVKSAMVYPMIVAGMALVTIVILAGFVLPRFKVFFEDLDAKLPLPTRMLLAFTDFFGHWWWAIGAVLAALIIGYILALRTNGGRHARDRVALRIPVVGVTIQFAMVERFCRILSSMVAAGVPLPRSLRVATDSLHNLVFERALAGVAGQMIQGEGLARPLASTRLFPSTASQMLRVGEDTGSLDTQLVVTAAYYEGELDYKIKKLTSLIEPVVIIAMGLMVGFVAVALVSAMYGVYSQVQ
jgi:type IV pilus assembly protein PilC